MISVQQAAELVRKHLKDNPFPEEGYVWVVTNPRRLAKGWVFEYEFDSKTNATPPEEWPAFAGAPAFVVGDDLSVRDLGWDEP